MKVKGIVIRGKQLGRKLGFPTANILLGAECDVPEGVYAARTIINGRSYQGMANVGRKCFSTEKSKNPNATVLEINIFDFFGDIYGQEIEVELLERMRGERNFATADELKATVDNDRFTIQEYFKTHR